MTIIVAQHARRADEAATVEAVLADLERRVTPEASFVVLPENAFAVGDGVRALPSRLRDQALERLAELARTRRAHVLTGSWAEPAAGGGLEQVARLGGGARGGAPAAGGGGARGPGRVHPDGGVGVELRRAVLADGSTGTGDDFPVVDTESGRVGVLLGPDFWLVEPPRIQCLNGAELLLVAGSLDGRNRAAQAAAVWGIATLNTVAVAFASALGARSAGSSAIAMPERFLARAGAEECLLEAGCEVEHIRYLREPDLRFQQTLWFGLWARRPQLYAALTDGPAPGTGADHRERVS
ncbi:carbon-nitrogen hydrolase family protein [Kitasatospora sp. NPDC059088]|uniref:carbon-nitrogen hydrolase family protein n=1 Tax=Kitasatospora sp. NPDC059088 TaxID=3346722 RepID=UPI0036BE82E7